eukprot:745910-Hanusia_phi.AAC.1
MHDNDVVCKFGMTKDLDRRLKEHRQEYGVYANVVLKLKFFCYVDETSIREAEADIKTFLHEEGEKLEYRNYKELV